MSAAEARPTHVFGGIPVGDFEAASAWYERLVGRPPDLIPHRTEVAWRLTDTGWIYVVADPERAGSALVTILVEDLDRLLRGLAERGIATGEVEAMPGGVRRTQITDPDGNRIAFGGDTTA